MKNLQALHNDKASPILRAISWLKCVRICIHLGYGAWQAFWYPMLAPVIQRHMLKSWSRELLAILDIEIIPDLANTPEYGAGCLLVSNHVSWLDIFVINAVHPCQFVAKSEVRDWPIVGWLCRRTGTYFIERTERRDAAKANAKLAQSIKHGASIGLFPEGTTTDGTHVAHFHAAMLQPALDSRATVHPVGLRYLDQNRQPSTRVLFTGETTLVNSLWKVLCSHKLVATVTFIPFDSKRYTDRKSLAQAAREVIAHHLQLPAAIPAKKTTEPRTIEQGSTPTSYGLLLEPMTQPHRE